MDQITMDVARRDAADWQTISRCGPELGVAFNVSAQNLHSLRLPERLEAIFEPAGLQTVAEGVESVEVLAQLVDSGVHAGQAI